jgi:hypothetical protein
MTPEELSRAVEALLVARNPRSMQRLAAALEPGYCLRAARALLGRCSVIIGTGFPVADTFETDGPPGAMALYRALERLGTQCHLACAAPLADRIEGDFAVLVLEAFDHPAARAEARRRLAELAPDAVVAIERPGLASDGRYYNMRGEDITPRCAIFDYYLELARCPTVAIGDGGNEIGMGRVADAVAQLSIRGAATSCDELVVADVSNWGAYGIVGLLEALSGKALLDGIDHRGSLAYLSARGSVDGVTRENTLTEDGFPADAGEELLERLGALVRRAKVSAA